jgi:hypothetical protein
MSRTFKITAFVLAAAFTALTAVSARTPGAVDHGAHAGHSTSKHTMVCADELEVPGAPCMMKIVALPHMVASQIDETNPSAGWNPGADPFAPMCTGTGSDGYRVNMIYVYDETLGSDLDAVAPTLRRMATEADRTIYLKSIQDGGTTRRVRFGTEATPTGCQIKITPVAVDHAFFTEENLSGLMRSLRAVGLVGMDVSATGGQIQAVMLDNRATPSGICGWAPVYEDERPVNNLNAAPVQKVLEITAQCWSPTAMTHELVHALGAISTNAPNTSGAGHCNDGPDIMCYNDGGPTATQRKVCTATVYRARLLDCNGDDYFNTAPLAGTYLATHWNTASSPWLNVTSAFTTAEPTMRVVSAPSSAPLLPFVGAPVTLAVSAESGVGYFSKATLDSCYLNTLLPPGRGATAATVHGVVACRVAGATGVSVAVADRLGRDAGARIAFTTVDSPTPLQAKVTTSVTRNTNGSFTLTAAVRGRLPGSAQFSTPLVGVRVWAMDETTRSSPLDGYVGTNTTTDGRGVATWTLGAKYAGHQIRIRNIETAPWVLETANVTMPSASTVQTLTFTAPATARAGTFPRVVASASSGLTVSMLSLTVPVCIVVGNAVFVKRAGICTVRANQSGNAVCAPAAAIDRSIRITP